MHHRDLIWEESSTAEIQTIEGKYNKYDVSPSWYINYLVHQSSEFIPGLAKYEPVYKEEEEAFSQWYTKTPMGKKRAKILEGDDEEKKDKGKKK